MVVVPFRKSTFPCPVSVSFSQVESSVPALNFRSLSVSGLRALVLLTSRPPARLAAEMVMLPVPVPVSGLDPTAGAKTAAWPVGLFRVKVKVPVASLKFMST